MSCSTFRRVLIHLFICLGYLALTYGNVVAVTPKYVQVDVEVVGDNPNGRETEYVNGVLYRLWDTSDVFTMGAFVAPDIRICVDNNGSNRCVAGDCSDSYFCTFIGVPIVADNFQIEVWDKDIAKDDLIGRDICGVNRVCQFGAARITVTAIPCDDKEIQVNYKDAARGRYLFYSGYEAYPSRYHHYSRPGRICEISTKGCDVKTVFSTMISQVRFVAPLDSNKPVVNCGDYHLPVNNPIRTVINAQDFSIVNYTHEGHIFHPGKVTRRVVSSDGWIVVITEGEGFGNWAWVNERVGPDEIFKEADERLAEAVKNKLAQPVRRQIYRRTN